MKTMNKDKAEKIWKDIEELQRIVDTMKGAVQNPDFVDESLAEGNFKLFEIACGSVYVKMDSIRKDFLDLTNELLEIPIKSELKSFSEINATSTEDKMTIYPRILYGDQSVEMISTQKCPVCEGRGCVPSGFYNGPGTTPYSSTAMETCKTCIGKGFIEVRSV